MQLTANSSISRYGYMSQHVSPERLGVPMNKEESVVKPVDLPIDTSDSSVADPVISSRRRLFRQGASVVAVTLASRPVLAWHCKSPSVMASDALRPASSLTRNEGRNWADETWGLTQWKGNAPRSKNSTDDDGDGTKDNEWWETNAPWTTLLNKVPGLKALNKSYNAITMDELASNTGIAIPAGSSSKKVVCFLGNCTHKKKHSPGTVFQNRVLVAQLNLVTLGGGAQSGWFNNGLENCVTLDQLNDMAAQNFSVNGKSWSQSEISDYLYYNWMSR